MGTFPGRLPGPDRVHRFAIPSGLGGVRRTLRLMVDVASTFKTDLHVRTLAVCLVGGRVVTLANGTQVRYPLCRPKDYAAELRCLHAFVRDHVRYVRDVEGIETLQTPIQTLNVLAGDCDDKAMLFNALAGAIGFQTRFAAIGVRDEPFSHVMAQALLQEGFVNAETILTDPPVELGWSPPDATSIMFAHCQ
jgi:transglutaminase-like putative cysteine protease